MGKMRLDVDALVVQSFQTDAAPQERGTVEAKQEWLYSYWYQGTCNNTDCGKNTCEQTCVGASCGDSCQATGCVTACDCVSAGCAQLSNTCQGRATCFYQECVGEQ